MATKTATTKTQQIVPGKQIVAVPRGVGILGPETEQPSAGWIAMQRRKPTPSKRWFRVFPLNTGGAMTVSEADLVVVRDATPADYEAGYVAGGFNPAAGCLRQLCPFGVA